MIPCSGYFRVERGYEIEKSIFNLIIGKSEGIDIEFRIEILFAKSPGSDGWRRLYMEIYYKPIRVQSILKNNSCL